MDDGVSRMDPRAGDPPTVALVLAGGRSARFGADKLAATFDGVPLLLRALGAAASVAGRTIVVRAPEGAPPSVADAELERVAPGSLIVHDERPFEGPLSGLVTGLRAARDGLGATTSDARAIVVAGDMPTLVPALLAAMLEALGRPVTPGELLAPSAVVLAAGATARPLPGALRLENALRAAEGARADGKRSLHAFLDRIPTRVLAEPEWRPFDPDAATLRDVDRREDLGAAP